MQRILGCHGAARSGADPCPVVFGLLFVALLGGCVTPSDKLAFPAHPIAVTADARAYDTDASGKPDFTLARSADGRFSTLTYDDNEDGAPDRAYHLADYAPADVPHVVILLDSVPFEAVRERFESSQWTWFDPPTKVIPPFPTMSPLIFSRILGAPPLPGIINHYYDRAKGRPVSRLFGRVSGELAPWERRLHYRLKYWENGLAFLYPRRWLRVDYARAKAAVDASPDRVTIVYLASTACIISKYGRAGVDECLDGLERLCLQLLHERRGAVKITALADHGHNLSSGERIDLPAILKGAGFTPAKRLQRPDDVVIELDGLVNYAGLHTRRAADVAAALAARPEIELAMHLDGDRVIVRDSHGAAEVRRRADTYSYTPIDHDVLGYAAVPVTGYAAADAWLAATADHRWPEAPPRIWEAFHTSAVNIPDVLITTRRGYYAGLASFDRWVDMASTHGGLDQDDSATFLLTMTGRATRPLRSADVLPTVEPTFDPNRLRR